MPSYLSDMTSGVRIEAEGAGLTITSTAATDITATDTAVLVAGTYAAWGASRGFLADTTNKRITRTGRDTVLALVTVTGKVDLTTGTDEINLYLFKNGTALSGITQSRTVTSGTPLDFRISTIVEFGVGDYVDLRVDNDDAIVDVTVSDMQFVVFTA